MDDAGVGGVDAIDIGVNLTHIGLERCRQRHRGGVRTAAAEGGHITRFLVHALETRNDADSALLQGFG